METIKQMVLGMLTFLDATTDDEKISFWVRQYMYALKDCLAKVDVEDESLYDFDERSLIANMVCIAILNQLAMEMAKKGGSGKYVKRAKAGSVETEFAVSESGMGFSVSFEDMLNFFKTAAYAKAQKYPCSLSVLGIAAVDVEIPFRVVEWPKTC
jgi:hypothetical protein